MQDTARSRAWRAAPRSGGATVAAGRYSTRTVAALQVDFRAGRSRHRTATTARAARHTTRNGWRGSRTSRSPSARRRTRRHGRRHRGRPAPRTSRRPGGPVLSATLRGERRTGIKAIELTCLQHGVDRFAPVAAETCRARTRRAATSHGSPQWRQTVNEASPGETAELR